MFILTAKYVYLSTMVHSKSLTAKIYTLKTQWPSKTSEDTILNRSPGWPPTAKIPTKVQELSQYPLKMDLWLAGTYKLYCICIISLTPQHPPSSLLWTKEAEMTQITENKYCRCSMITVHIDWWPLPSLT